MRKKCVPGTFCIENMTLGLVLVIGMMVAYLYYVHFKKPIDRNPSSPIYRESKLSGETTYPISNVPLDDPYVPPMKTDAVIRPTAHPSVPVNVRTSTADLPYTQVGILTKNDRGATILPLMGRNLWNGRGKWQYYTMSNTAGALNTKLPISVNGRSCTGEYGCDSISNGDTVYVEGYNETFRATVYENSVLQYLPL